jgi:ABC-type transporter Mla maintaining outer membrane lipid asymmetry ATPase subunit MlaF
VTEAEEKSTDERADRSKGEGSEDESSSQEGSDEAATEALEAPEIEAPESRENLLVPDVERWPLDPDKPIIELEDVHKSFGDNDVLCGLDLEIRPGEITVIIGASASGKSVLIKHMNGLLVPDSGHVRLFGKDTRELGDVALDRLRKRVGTLFQNYALFDSMTVVENVAFPLVENKVMDRGEARELASELLEDLGLGDSLDLYPSSLSGGMKKRVSLARSIITNPEVVLFDEPTTGLDPIMMEFVDELIQRITREYHLTAVIISHDMASTFRLADSIAVLHGGQIIAHDTPDVIREMDDERVSRLIGGSDKTDIDMSVGEGELELEGIEEEAAVIVRGVHKSFGDKHVLRGVDMTVPAERVTVLIGGSGSGKSVLMKHILGIFRPDEGFIEVMGRDLSEMSDRELREMRSTMGMLFQHAALFDSMSVLENVAFPLVERREVGRSEAHERARKIIEDLKLTGVIDRTPPEISNGQQKRASLARALITEPRMIIYDEPTTGQDPIMCSYVDDMITEVQEKFEVTSLVISHDMSQTFRIGDHVAMLYHGEIIAEGSPRELLYSEDERVRDFIFAAEVAEGGEEERDVEQMREELEDQLDAEEETAEPASA